VGAAIEKSYGGPQQQVMNPPATSVALENILIGDFRLVSLFAEKTLQAIFGVLQHYPPTTGHSQIGSARLKGAE
jgi:hypothetical protein